MSVARRYAPVVFGCVMASSFALTGCGRSHATLVPTQLAVVPALNRDPPDKALTPRRGPRIMLRISGVTSGLLKHRINKRRHSRAAPDNDEYTYKDQEQDDRC